MSPPSDRCAEVRALLPEVALGIADGGERASALAHAATCPECRRELEHLAALADDLLALAPEREPPAGFEARVLERLRPVRAPRMRRARAVRLVLAPLAAAAVTAFALMGAYRDDHRLASQYRAALMGAHGKYFQSGHLRAPDGRVVGTVFGYEGSPSWVFYMLDPRYSSGRFREQLVTRSGRVVALPAFGFVDGSWGIATPVPVRDIARVRLTRVAHGQEFEAALPPVDE